MELVGAIVGLSMATWGLVAVAAGVAFPLFWLWMVVDALGRAPATYPGQDIAEKVLWVVHMLVTQPAAVLYFFIVWRRSGSAFTTSYTPVPA